MSPSAVTSEFRITAQDDFTSATIEVPSTTINRSASASGPRSRSSYQNHVGPAYVKAFCPRSRTACKVQSSDKVLRSRRSDEHTSELQSLMRISYAVFCLKTQRNEKQEN